MNAENIPNDSEQVSDAETVLPSESSSPSFARNGLERLDDFKGEVLDLNELLLDIKSFGGEEATKNAQKLIEAVDAFEPSITMIGQIKSGKTSLINAMAGRPDLLPADVNPWTSVVTSLHLNTPVREDGSIASFQFFDQNEWDHLVENGGRFGELASRAGAADELQKVRDQVSEMRDKTKARLGRKFELLLGQTHNYRHLDDELLQRYVCMGDDFGEPNPEDSHGQFADITKSAELYLEAPSLTMPMCIRDTPGVNDTFMMREQITINALRGSRICVVVLSATQALSSMDMGLIRLISNVKSREVVIFVNRVDELANPTQEIPEIRESIISTLANNNGPADIQVLFGSAYWANMALQGAIEDIVPESAASLRNYAGDQEDITPELVWKLSGVPSLYDEIGKRIVEGEGAEMITAIRKRALNHLHGLKATSTVVSLRLNDEELEMIDPDLLRQRLYQAEEKFRGMLQGEINSQFERYSHRVDQAHQRFLGRALESLLQHLETNGESEPWQYSPDGLRLLLRSSYQTLRKSVSATCDTVYAAAADDFSQTYHSLMSVDVEGFAVTPPDSPQFPSPVSLGQTIALDLQTSWWNGWWKRRKGYRAYADSFYELIEAETLPMINDLKSVQVEDIRRIAMGELEEFLTEQIGILRDVSFKSQISHSELNNLFGITAQEERDELFGILFEELAVEDDEDFVVVEETQSKRPGRPTRPTSQLIVPLTEGDAV